MFLFRPKKKLFKRLTKKFRFKNYKQKKSRRYFFSPKKKHFIFRSFIRRKRRPSSFRFKSGFYGKSVLKKKNFRRQLFFLKKRHSSKFFRASKFYPFAKKYIRKRKFKFLHFKSSSYKLFLNRFFSRLNKNTFLFKKRKKSKKNAKRLFRKKFFKIKKFLKKFVSKVRYKRLNFLRKFKRKTRKFLRRPYNFKRIIKSLKRNRRFSVKSYIRKTRLILKNTKNSIVLFSKLNVSNLRLGNSLKKTQIKSFRARYFIKLVQSYNNFFILFGSINSGKIFLSYSTGRVDLRRNRRLTSQAVGIAARLFSKRIKLFRVKFVQLIIVGKFSHFIRKFAKTAFEIKLRISSLNHVLRKSHNGLRIRSSRRV